MAKQANKHPEHGSKKGASKTGRPCAYTPETLAAKFDEYREWIKDNPRKSYKMTKDGVNKVETDRPMTLVGFCQFAGIIVDTFRGYERRGEFFGVQCARVREAIEADQLEGAMVGQYAQSIVARVLKLADRTEVVDKSEEERISEMTDEELQAEIDELNAIP